MSTPTLQTDRLVLTPLAASDAADLHGPLSDPETLRYWHRMPSPGVEATRAHIAAMIAAEGACQWAIRLATDGPAVGHVGWLATWPGRRSAFGYLIDKAHWGRGLASEAARAALQYGFTERGAAGAELWIYEENRRSVRVAEKLGCRLRGRFVGFNVERGEQIPTLVYGVTARDFGVESPPPDPVGFYGLHPVVVSRDVQASIDHYCRHLGFVLDWAVGDPPQAAAVTRADWAPIGATIRFTHVDDEPAERPGWLSISVDDVDRLHDEYRRSGADIAQPPVTQPWGLREMEVVDCHGQRLSFITPARAAAGNG